MTAKRITKATIKAFIRKNLDNLYIRNKSSFDSMTDGKEACSNVWRKAITTDEQISYTLGIQGVCIVGGSRNLFNSYSDDEFEGFEIYNCCDHFFLGIKK